MANINTKVKYFIATDDGSVDVGAQFVTEVQDNASNGYKTIIPEGVYRMDAAYFDGIPNDIEIEGSGKVIIQVDDLNGGAARVSNSDVAGWVFDGRDDMSSEYDIIGFVQEDAQDTYNIVSRFDFMTPAEAGNFSKYDRFFFYSDARPFFDLSNRMMGESGRVLKVDNSGGYVWMWGQAEFAEEYLGANGATTDSNGEFVNAKMRKFGNAKIKIKNIRFEPVTTPDVAQTERPDFIRFLTCADVTVENCEFYWPHNICMRFQTCADCVVQDCYFQRGINNVSYSGGDIDHIAYGVQVYASSYNIMVQNNRFENFRHCFTTDGHSSSSVFASTSYYNIGQPTHITIANNHSISASGASWDTHEEGSAINFVNNITNNAIKGDPDSGIVGYTYQIRSKRTKIIGSAETRCANSIKWKPVENGTENWLVVNGLSSSDEIYPFGEGTFFRVETDIATFTDRPVAYVHNSSSTNAGRWVQGESNAVVNFYNCTFVGAYDGPCELQDDGRFNFYNCVLDFNSMTKSSGNTSIIQINDTGGSTFIGNTIIMGENGGNLRPVQLFDTADATTGKPIVFKGNTIIDPHANGYPVLFDSVAEFTLTNGGYVEASPNGTLYEVQVDNAGSVTT